MNMPASLDWLALVGVLGYLGHLAIRSGMSFEAGGGGGIYHFFIKTKPRRR